MMRRAGTSPELTVKSISKSYCSTDCLEGQISVGLILALPAHAPAFFPPSANRAAPNSGHIKKG